MITWVTSDLHFGHKSILNFCPTTRPYKDTDEMDISMVEQFNSVVSPEDTIYFLGDIAFCSGNKAANILCSMNGTKILIVGNHDKKLLESSEFVKCFKEIHIIHSFKYNGNFIVMCHYPIYDHERSAYGSIMLHGHRHGNPTGIPGRIKDVGLDATGNIVTKLDDIIEEMKLITPMHHHPN